MIMDENSRAAWWPRLVQMVEPVFSHLAEGRLRMAMPVECHPNSRDRGTYTHLEAVGRSLAGCAPWLDCPRIADPAEATARNRLRSLVITGLGRHVTDGDPDRGNFEQGAQPIVDAAFLVHGLLRAPCLWQDLPDNVRQRMHACLRATRTRRPNNNNWLLFAGLIEGFLAHTGAEDWDRMRVDYAIRQHEQWYAGDGIFGDGPRFHADYYNSFVIHPMLRDLLEVVVPLTGDWARFLEGEKPRFARYAAIQERMIAPDGSYPALGRSLAYRCGAFQHLAMAALIDALPGDLAPGQVRAALAAVISRTLDAPGTWDDDGWLRIGLCGHQPAVGEDYISTGSLYLASTAFLPLGLASDHPFWIEPSRPWTNRRIFDLGENVAANGALKDDPQRV